MKADAQEFRDLSFLSFSFATFIAVEEWSNVVTKDGEGNYHGGELFGKKLVAAITYLLLPVIALIEGVVRGVFALLATAIAPCLSGKYGEYFREKFFIPLASGAMISFATAFLSLEGFGLNFQKPTDIPSTLLSRDLPPKNVGEEEKLSSGEQLYFAYWRGMKCFIDCLKERGWFTTGTVMGTLLTEFPMAIRTGMENLFHGCSDTPHFSGINPSQLTSEQLKYSPVLFIHGNYHNPSGCTALAQALKEAHNPALFTVSLNHGIITEEDEARVAKRVQEIQDLYAAQGVENVKVDLIGHSRGAAVANAFAKLDWDWQRWDYREPGDTISWRETVGKVILLGFHHIGLNLEAFQGKYHEINGRYEALMRREVTADAIEQEALHSSYRKVVPEGHLGLLFHPETHDQIIEWLQES